MRPTDHVSAVLSHYYMPRAPEKVQYLGGAGGFSGARIWKVAADGKSFCLRQWPVGHPTIERLQWMHRVLQQAARAGLGFLPLPLPTRDGQTCIRKSGHLWELTPWMPGNADYLQAPSVEKLQAALKCLAQFHVAVAAFDGRSPETGRSDGFALRASQLRRYLQGGLVELQRQLHYETWPEVAEIGHQLIEQVNDLGPRFLPELSLMSHQRFPLQICIKDIWHDHILFDGQRVGGIVDFGAMNIDTVASDLARLLGSLVGDSTVVPTTFNADSGIDGGTGGDGESTDSWQLGLAAYHCVRPLSDGERRAVQVWDRANVLLSGLQWLSWVFIDGREFENRPAIVSRCRDNLARLIALSGASPTS